MKAIFLDEIGPLELAGKGFDGILQKMLKSRSNIYITVREDLIQDVVTRYDIKKYQLIKTGD
jgi:nucleoside-triphosphatase THEP1